MNIEQCFCVMRLRVCLLTEIKRYKSAIRIRILQICRISSLGVNFSGKEISLILKNKMAAADISLKIIYIFLLAFSHR